jgi:hypothetical protein
MISATCPPVTQPRTGSLRPVSRGDAVPARTASEPCVVHLVRAANGLEPFVAFFKSYAAHPAGVEHELALVFKGFGSKSDADPYLRLAEGQVSETVFIGDEGFDLTAYFAAANRLRRERYCFLNSYSEIVADGWLALMNTALDEPGVGLVGATGSWASMRSLLRFQLGLGGRYAPIFGKRARTREVIRRIEASRLTDIQPSPGRLGSSLRTATEMCAQALYLESFPSPHIRTNAFMLSGDVINKLRIPRLRTKTDAYRAESGRHSLTRQVERLGLRPVLVARDGAVHEVAAWAGSGVFWQRRQENVLVADNQTRDYEYGDAELRSFFSRYAWGEQATPA